MRITALSDAERQASWHRLVWLATGDDGSPLGVAYLRIFTNAGDEHRAELDVQVHPAEQRRGVGTALLQAATTAARERGRRSVQVGPVRAGEPCEHFLAAAGLRPVLSLTYARLAMRTLDVDGLREIVARPHPGYRLEAWEGTVPDELAESFASSRCAMDDMPMDETDIGVQVWDVERVRAVARAVAERGDRLRTVAAVCEADGSVAGFSELVVGGDGRGDAQHYGTGVLQGHRGHGLGCWMKAFSILDVQAHYPEVAGLLTDTADSNVAMRRINDRLGYQPTHRSVLFQSDL